MKLFGKFALILVSGVFAGCTTNYSTLTSANSASKTIYEISEAQAFQLASNAITDTFPGNAINELTGDQRGYSTNFLAPPMYVDSYTQVVKVYPVSGLKEDQVALRGYYFEVSGKGSSFVQGQAKNKQLFDTVRAYADRTGKGVLVTNIARRPYEIQPIKKNGISEISNQELIKSDSARLEQLKNLFDKGLISESEYQAKRKQILEGL